MANFNTHFTVAATASAVISGTLLSMEVVTPEQAVIAFVLGTLGGLLPDVDSAHSTSIKVGFNVLSLLMTIMLIFVKSSTYSIVEMLIMSVLVFAGIRYGFLELFRKISKHRGMFHSVPVALIWGIVVAILMHFFFGLNSLVSWVYGFMITAGYLVHLILDETYSVDLGNRRVKKSLGTALKFYSIKTMEDKIHTALVYAALVVLFFVAPDTSMIEIALFSQEAWEIFKDVVIPYDGQWFFH
ncbi:metal-dependent hydrolase [bacterium]|nr:metal-dependent hydrolase [bacterium]MBU1957469.1 metal-dependent hydrolase [bacterium]